MIKRQITPLHSCQLVTKTYSTIQDEYLLKCWIANWQAEISEVPTVGSNSGGRLALQEQVKNDPMQHSELPDQYDFFRGQESYDGSLGRMPASGCGGGEIEEVNVYKTYIMQCTYTICEMK